MAEDSSLLPLFELLTNDGFRPRWLDEGPLIFSAFQTEFLLAHDALDPNFLVVRMWHDLEGLNLEQAARAANIVNGEVKVAKANLEDGQLALSAEFLYGEVGDILHSVTRAARALDHALHVFHRAFRTTPTTVGQATA